MQKLFSERIEDCLFEVYSADRLAIPEKLESRFFSLALLVDGTRYSNDELFAFAGECLRKGLCYLVAWGPACERVHDVFDEEMIDDSGNDRYLPANASSGDVVMTTWHSKDTLAQALFFFVYCAFPTDVFEAEWKHRIILSVGSEEWTRKSVRYIKAVPASRRRLMTSGKKKRGIELSMLNAQCSMPKKKKRLSATKLVKAMAREAIGTPPPTRRAPDAKKKAKQKSTKHKPTLGRMLSQEE